MFLEYSFVCVFLLDSGAIAHICTSLSSFISFTHMKNTFVTLPNNHKVPVIASGSVKLAFGLILHNVLCIPDFHINIISVGSLNHGPNYHISFSDNPFLIQETHQQWVIGRSDFHHGLYFHVSNANSVCFTAYT